MQIRAAHAGGELPFEGERRLVLRRIPVGAVVSHASLTLTPVSADPGGRYLETITLPAGTGTGTWGAAKVVTTTSVEVDLHARRRLASLQRTGAVGVLLVDLGGGFLDVTADGGIGDGPSFPLQPGSNDLPGLPVTGLRIPAAGDVSAVQVSSPPSAVTVAIDGGPVVLTHVGDLVTPVTADVSGVLQAVLAACPVEDGCHVVPFVVRTGSISRLDLELVVDLTLAVSAAPEGVRAVQAAYRYDGTPVGGQGALSVQVPEGMAVASVSGRARGAFGETRVLHGPPAGVVLAEPVPVEAGQALAQPVTVPADLTASSVDLFLTAVTAEAELAVDLVDDLDGKPGRASALPRSAATVLTRDAHGAPTWVQVVLPGPVELRAGHRVWLTVQAVSGRASWNAGASPTAAVDLAGTPGLQQTRDGGLSWRVVRPGQVPAPADGLGAGLRLRHVLPAFRVPLELRVSAGEAVQAVSLQRFAPTGGVDLGLDVPEVAEAMNAVVTAAGGGARSSGAEAVANGDFAEWFRLGSTARSGGTVRPTESAGVGVLGAVFLPDGSRAVALAREERDDLPDRVRLLTLDPLARAVTRDTLVGEGTPTAVVVDPTGRRALVAGVLAAAFDGASGPVGWLRLVDLGSGLPQGGPVPVPEPVVEMVSAPDGTLWLACLRRDDQHGAPLQTVLRGMPWARLAAAASGSALDWDALAHDAAPGLAVSITADPGGGVALVTVLPSLSVESGSSSSARLYRWPDRAAVSAGDRTEVPLVGGVAAASTPDGGLVVATADRVRFLDPDLRTRAEATLPAGQRALALGLDAQGTIGLVAREDGAAVLDVRSRRATGTGFAPPPGEGRVRVTVSPAGTHALLTRADSADLVLLTLGDALPAEWELTAGTVRPVSLGTTGEVLALLGEPTRSSKQPVAPQASALAQVVPVQGGARYRFGFDAIALVEGARGEVRWRGADCSPSRTDRVPVPVLDLERRGSLDRVPRQEAVLVAPVGAVQAEVRFTVPESALLVDHVTLGGSADTLGTSWSPSAPGVSLAQADVGIELANGGAAPAAVSQVVAVSAGATYELELRAAVSGEPALARLVFADDRGVAVGDAVEVPLDPLDLDLHGAVGQVPAGAVEAELRLELPVGASLRLTAASLAIGRPLEVGLVFTAEAPGDLTVTDVGVVLTEPVPRPLPVPAGGLCAPTPGAGGEGTCHCQACGRDTPAARVASVRTAAGRPAGLTPCATCGTPRVRLGGSGTATASLELPRFRTLDRVVGAAARPALVARTTIDVPLTEIAGIGQVRAAELGRVGVGTLVDLARADPVLVARLPGVSDRMAVRFVAEAGALVRARGERVLFG